jgi:hypothetical protein
MTALAEALTRAGYVSPRARLEQIAELAWSDPQRLVADDSPQPPGKPLLEVAMHVIKQSNRNWDAAKDALFRAVRNDPDLLWQLFEPYRAQAAQRILTEASQRLHQERSAGQFARENLPRTARPNGGIGQIVAENPVESANSAARPAQSTQQSQPAHDKLAGLKAIAEVHRLSMLDKFQINGKPIGELTPLEARKWAQSRKRDVRFVELLTANLPPDRLIKEFILPSEADAVYERAQRETAGE